MSQAAPVPLAPPDAALVHRSLAGDAAAFGLLYERHAAGIAVHLRRSLPGARLDLADAVQDAFVRAWCRLPQLRDPARFGPWARSIAVSAALDTLRMRGREIPVAALPEAAATATTDDAIALRQAMAALPGPQRAAITLCDLQGLTVKEAAGRLGLPPSTLRGRLALGRAALRAELTGQGTRPLTTATSLAGILAAVRRRAIDEDHDLRGRSAVLFCGVPLAIEVLASPDDRLHLRGSVWAVGERALGATTLRCDGVDNALAVGPHPGMLFAGTRGGPGGSLEAVVETLKEAWVRVRDGLEVAARQGDAVGAAVRDALLRPCLRLSLTAAEVTGASGGETDAAALAQAGRLLFLNHTSERGWHGPEVGGALTVEVPAGCTLGIAGFWSVETTVAVRETTASVLCLDAAEVTAQGLIGDLTLWESQLASVAGLRGALRQRCTRALAGNWDHDRGARIAPPVVTITGLNGSADIAVDLSEIFLDAPEGSVAVDNRFGSTTARLGTGSPFSGSVRSTSGVVRLQVPDGVPVPAVKMTTTFGEVRWTGHLSRDWDMDSWNTPSVLGVRRRGADPAITLHSEAGVAGIERLPAPAGATAGDG